MVNMQILNVMNQYDVQETGCKDKFMQISSHQ